MGLKECERCGGAIAPPKVRFCSKHCCDMHSHEHAERPLCTCKYCGKEYRPKAANRTTFCSRDCSYAFKSQTSQKEKERAKLERLWKRLAKHSAVIKEPKICEVCGVPVPPRKYGRALCDGCRHRLLAVRRKRAKVRREAREKVHCREYLAAMRSKFKRTNGQCKLCGQAITLNGDPNHDRRCEFDHKIPLGVGGRDAIDNIQAICRKCNNRKGAFTSPDVVIGQWMRDMPVGV
jgi:5-methylcytosine-specific restriction endonuclease McrA